MAAHTEDARLDGVALRAAEWIEETYAQTHTGGPTQRLAKIQVFMRTLLDLELNRQKERASMGQK